MAKNNKYTSINFNHIYEKSTNNTSTNSSSASKPAPKSTNPSSFSASYSAVSAPNKPHGRILVLTRPTPKPVNPPAPKTNHNPSPIQTLPDQTRSEPGSDAISLRPLGRTGTGPALSGPTASAFQVKDKAELPPPPLISPKTDKFVPPHLRPGFVPKEEAAPPGHVRSSPGRYGEDGRPKSGGYDKMRRGVGSDMSLMGRPRSSENRPSSSG